jgi:hypothetical protein
VLWLSYIAADLLGWPITGDYKSGRADAVVPRCGDSGYAEHWNGKAWS